MDTEYLYWWKSDDQTILRSILIADTGISVSATVTVTSKDGTVVPTKLPGPIYHDALRFFRLSQVTDDLFDAFRNMYLCFERILAYKVPRKSGESEGNWLRRAMAELHSLYNLPNVYSSQPNQLVQDLYQKIYIDIRCKVFHAKDGLSILAPQDISASKLVRDALAKLSHIVVHLCIMVFHIQRKASALSTYAFKAMSAGVFNDIGILVTDCPNDLDLNIPDIHEVISGFNQAYVQAAHSPGLSDNYIYSVLGHIDVNSLLHLDGIRSYYAVKEEKIMLDAKLEGILSLSGKSVFEPHFAFRLNNIDQPKKYFKR